MKKNILFACFIALTFFACNNNKITPIQYEIPESLMSDEPINDFLEEYSIEGGKMIAVSQNIRSGLSMPKMIQATSQMSKASDRIKEMKSICPEIEAGLSELQQRDFKKVIYRLDASIGQLKTDLDAIDESEIAAVQAKKGGKQQEVDSIMAVHEAAIAQQKAEGTYAEPSSESNNIEMPRYMTFIFPVLGIFAIIMMIYFSVFKRIRNKVSEVGYVMNDAKDAMTSLKQKVKEGEAEGKTLSDEERKGIEFIDKFLNK